MDNKKTPWLNDILTREKTKRPLQNGKQSGMTMNPFLKKELYVPNFLLNKEAKSNRAHGAYFDPIKIEIK